MAIQGSQSGPAYLHHQWHSFLGSGHSGSQRAGRMFVPTCRRDPNLGQNTQINSTGESFYNALQLGVNKRLSHGLQLQANYVFSKALDDSQGILADGSGQVSDPLFTKKFDWGPSPYDVRHNLRLNLLYQIPSLQAKNFAATLTKGWWMGNILAAQSGFPFSPTLSYVSCLCGGVTDRADIVTAGNLAQAKAFNPNAVVYDPNTVIIGSPKQWFNPNMFTVPALGTHGDLGRNVFRGPGLTTWDLSLNKDTAIRALGEGGNLQFRAEFFNLLNHPNFASPSTAVASQQGISGTAGVISSTTTNARQVQLALKLIF
jgi:hypothetical protein